MRAPATLPRAPAHPAPPAAFHARAALLALGLFAVHLAVFEVDRWWGDTYQYLLHAENLTAGRPYADTGYVPSPESYVAPVAYPTGYPLLIAPVVAAFGFDPRALSVVASLCLIAAAWAAGTLARRTVPDGWAYSVVVLVGLQPGLIATSWQPLSDLPFMAFALLAVLAAERATGGADRPAWDRRRVGWAVLAGAAGAAATLTRSLGVVLVPTVLLVALLHRRSAGAAALAVGVGAAAFAALQFDVGGPSITISAEGAGYAKLVQQDLLGQLGQIPARVPRQALDYARAAFPLWLVPDAPGLTNGFAALALVPVAVGFWTRARRRVGVPEAFAVLYVLALLPWTFSGTRYLFPVYPLYYLFLVVGLWRIAQRGARWRAAVAVAGLAVAVSYGARYGEWAGRPPGSVAVASDVAVYRFVRERTPEAAVVATTSDPRYAAFYARRPAATGPDEAERWPGFVRRLGATHVVAREGSGGAAWAGQGAERLYGRGDLAVYRVCRGPCADPAGETRLPPRPARP